jgi:hypothetical protein
MQLINSCGAVRVCLTVFDRNIQTASCDGMLTCYSGMPELGGSRGSRLRCPLGGARGAKVPFQFKGLPWRNSELSEMLVRFFYEFASENARNAVIELQE